MPSTLLDRARVNRLNALGMLPGRGTENVLPIEEARRRRAEAEACVPVSTTRKPGTARPIVRQPRAA